MAASGRCGGGAGLSGLVSAAEAYNAGCRVLILDQEPEASLGRQAHWSFGGLFLVDSPEQRWLGAKDSPQLALSDWRVSAAFDRPEDFRPRRWAGAHVDFATGEKRAWLHALGVRFFPLVQWAERLVQWAERDVQWAERDVQWAEREVQWAEREVQWAERDVQWAERDGNSIPRFHVVWGTGPGIPAPFLAKVKERVAAGRVQIGHRHRVAELVLDAGSVTGARGRVLENSGVERGKDSSREAADNFSVGAGAVIVSTGGIAGNHAMVREQWPNGRGPGCMLAGVPASVDGLFQQAVAQAGGALTNTDRMWHYPEGIHNPEPVWPNHGIRILSGPSPLWPDATGHRLPVPLFPGFDSLGTLRHLETTGHEHSWFVLNKSIIGKEFALSGSERNPDLTGKDMLLLAKRTPPGATGPMQKFIDHGDDFVQADSAEELALKMNAMIGGDLIDPAGLHKTLVARENGPLFAVRLTTLTRKSLGGLSTDLSSGLLSAAGTPLAGLYAAGEAACFGGGGMHGCRSLEGTFLGGCLFSGLTAGRHAASATKA